jgi:hypothetical protein
VILRFACFCLLARAVFDVMPRRAGVLFVSVGSIFFSIQILELSVILT